MILQSLVRLAERQELLSDPGYAHATVHWIVDLEPDGTPSGVVSTAEPPPPGARRKTPSYLRLLIPKRIPGRTALRVLANPIVDNAQYLFGWLPTARDRLDLDRLARCANESLALTARIAAETGDPTVQAQAELQRNLLENPTLLAQAWQMGAENTLEVVHFSGVRLAVPRAWASNHLVAMRVGGEYVARRPAVRAHLAAAASSSEGAPQGTCLVTGRHGPLATLHDPVPLPGDAGTIPLVSFNEPAFRHYRRVGAENAPVGVFAADAYYQALKHLLEPTNRRRFLLAPDTAAVFWCDVASKEDDPAEDLALWFGSSNPDADPAEVAAVYASPRSGGRPPLIEDPTPFFSLVITRVKSRAILRTAELHTVGEVASAVRAFAQETDMCPRYADERDHRRLDNLINGTLPASRKARPQAALATRLYRAALDARLPFPRELLAVALTRVRAHDDEGISRRRAAIIRAVLNRTCRRDKEFRKEVPVSLESDHPSVAYQLGRLFAAIERLQQDATQAGAGIGERFLGTAMTAPALVFPRLLKLSKHHVAKVESGDGPRRNWPKLLDEIVGRLPPELPRTQSLTEQGTFVVGYHHQRADLWKKTTDRPKAEARVTSSPATESEEAIR